MFEINRRSVPYPCADDRSVCNQSFARCTHISRLQPLDFYLNKTNILVIFLSLFSFNEYIIMFNCGQCTAQFNRKFNLTRHEKSHNAVRLSCSSCFATFTNKSNLSRHNKIKHGMYRTFDILIFFSEVNLFSFFINFFIL